MKETKRPLRFLNLLVSMARDVTPVGEARVAACLVLRHSILSFGVNQPKTDPFTIRFQKNVHAIFPHAEVYAIKHAIKIASPETIKKCTLYVARARQIADERGKNHFVWGYAKPCIGCEKAIKEYDIKRVVYTTNDNGIFEIL